MGRLAGLPKCVDNACKSELMTLFETYVTCALSNLRRNLVEPLPSVDNCLVVGLMNILDCLLDEFVPKEGVEPASAERVSGLKANLSDMFVFALIWSIMITSNDTGRRWWNAYLRTELAQNGTKCGLKGTEGRIFDYCFDTKTWTWRGWMETQPA